MNRLPALLGLLAALAIPALAWVADNGNGTFTNPLFYEEFSDPDLIRVGDDYYLTGTTMHAMPGLPILHSRDLVNWELLGYACERLDLGPEFRLENGKDAYGQGIWATSFRYHAGTFHIFSNVNKHTTQHFTATNPAGPWKREAMKVSLHDLSVLFDDDGKVWAVWGYQDMQLAQLNPELNDIVPGTQRTILPKASGMGEGAHFYKIDGRYFVIGANYDPVGYMVCARSARAEGPYEVATISAEETFGVSPGWRLRGMGREEGFNLQPPAAPAQLGAIPLHQGGIVQTSQGEWWGFSMMDHNSIGRLTCLSPVTWRDGWPFFGLPGNLLRTPQTWIKPAAPTESLPFAPYRRDDDFSGPALNPIWQWNHVPDDSKWSLIERPGFLRLHTQPAGDFLVARNTLTQRAIGPVSSPTVDLDFAGLKVGDVAGLALLNYPFAWIGVQRTAEGFFLAQFDQLAGKLTSIPLLAATRRIRLRADCDFVKEEAIFSYRADGENFTALGGGLALVFQLRTFQGVRYSLFAYNTRGIAGGVADFAKFSVAEPQANGAGHRLPLEKTITLTSLADGSRLVAWNGLLRSVAVETAEARGAAARFRVRDRGLGRVVLESADGGRVAVTGTGGIGDVKLVNSPVATMAEFQWQDLLTDEVMLLSLATQRYLFVEPCGGGLASADSSGARPGKREGSCFRWAVVDP